MVDNSTKTRYGSEVDEHSADLIDALDEAFEDVNGWDITDASSVAIEGNRHFLMEEVTAFESDGKIHSGVYQAIHDAGLLVTASYTNAEGPNTCRVWVTEGE